MDTKQERWAVIGTVAVVVAVMAATWLLCESTLSWRDTFRLEDLAAARGQDDDFEAYRPDGVTASATALIALALTVVAVVVAVIAGTCARRWNLGASIGGTVVVLAAVLAGTMFPFGPFLLAVAAIPVALALRSLARPSADRAGFGAGHA